MTHRVVSRGKTADTCHMWK